MQFTPPNNLKKLKVSNDFYNKKKAENFSDFNLHASMDFIRKYYFRLKIKMACMLL